jgi:hypothetical protein
VSHEKRAGEIVAEFHGGVVISNQAMRARVSVR